MISVRKVFLLMLGSSLTAFGSSSFSPCDVNQDGFVNVGDVKYMINEVLGVNTRAHDLNHDGAVNTTDVQIIIQAVLGNGCPAAPGLTGLNPSSGLPGQQSESLSVTGFNTHWVQGTTTASFGNGITVGTLTVSSATSAIAILNIDLAAALGTRNVTFTTGAEVATLAGGFTVSGGPMILSVNANTGQQGVQGLGGGGSIFLTGHDPDWHALEGNNGLGAQDINQAAVRFITDPVYNPFAAAGIHKFLYVTSKVAPPGIWADGTLGLIASGFVEGTDFDRADASILVVALGQLGTTYNSIVVASDFGGILSQAELDILDASSAAIIAFLNRGGGLCAMAETPPAFGGLANTGFFGFLPFVVTSVPSAEAESSNTVTPFGIGLGLGNGDVNGNFSHNSFASTGGLTIVDTDGGGEILTLAGRGKVTTGGLTGVVLTGASTNFVQDVTTASFGSGITVTSLTVNSPTSATAVLNIDPAAPLGPHDVTLTTGAEVAVLHNGFTVTAATPLLTLVYPTNGQTAQMNERITISGQATHWVQGATTASFGAGISVASLTIYSPTAATAVLNIDPAAAIGARTVTFTTGAEVATLTGGFSVTGAPVLTLVNPNTGQQGVQGESINLTGLYTNWVQGISQASFGGGAASVNNFTVKGTADLWLAGQPDGLLLGGDSGPANSPVLAWSGQNSGVGRFLTILATGTVDYGGCSSTSPDGEGCGMFSFGPALGMSYFPGPANALIGVFLNAANPDPGVPAALDFTTLDAQSKPTISPELNQVFMVGDGLTGTGSGAAQQFFVPVGATQLYLGSSDAPGANFNNIGLFSAVVTDSGTLSTLTVNSPTSATVSLNIDVTAAVGARDVTVTTGAGVARLSSGFTVTAGPTLLSISPASALAGQANLPITITGLNTHFTNASAIGLGSGMMLGAVSATDATHLSAQLTIAGTGNLVQNGSLEDLSGLFVSNGSSYMRLSASSTTIAGWTVTPSTTAQIVWGQSPTADSHYASNGKYFVDLTGLGANPPNGAISQQLRNLVSGQQYTFSMDTLVDNGQPLVTIGSATVTLTAGQPFHIGFDAWVPQTGVFVADSASPILTIGNQPSNQQHCYVDNIVVAVPGSAALGSHNLTVSTGSEVEFLLNGFTVNAAPVVVSVTPASEAQTQTNVPVTITGQYTHFSNASVVTFSGAGVTAGAPTSASATSVTVLVTVAAAAALGSRQIQVQTGAETVSLAGAFTVIPLIPMLTQASPNGGQQGQQSESVAVTGQFTHWVQGTTSASFGAGVTVVSLTVDSASTATAVLNIDPAAALGARNVVVTTGGEVVTLQSGFTVNAGTPVLTLLSPNAGTQGQVGESVSLTGQFTHWAQGSTTASFGAGITVQSLTILSATTATAVLNIDPAAMAAHDVTVSTGAESVTLNGGFTVNAVTPALTLLNPNTGLQGQVSESVSITGQFTHWVQGSTTASFGAGITVQSLTILSATTATAVLNIDPAAIGAHNVTVSTGAEVAALNGGFTVNAGAPALTLISPNTGQQSQQNQIVTLTGQFTHWAQGTTTASFGAGITVASLTISSPTTATAALNIDPAAAAGTRTVTVTTGAEAVARANGFTVAVYIPVPTITSSLPGSSLQGQTMAITITGQNTHFQQGVTKASFGAGVSVGGGPVGVLELITVTSATTATANVSVPATTATGARTILVRTGTEEASLIGGFIIKGTPYLSSIAANSAHPGDALSVSIHGTFTNFQQGVTTATFGAGISVGGAVSGVAGPVTVLDAGTATAQLTIDPNAAVGLRNPVVTTGAVQVSLGGSGFTVIGPVTGPPPAVTISSPSEGDQVTSPSAVTGSVTSPNLSNWVLEYQASGSTTFTPFSSGTSAAVSATFDPTLLLNGIAQLRLTATDVSGQTGVFLTDVVVAGKAKVGNFSVAFNDLTIPVAGIPIQIDRAYDSRNKGVGDFGFGWTLAIQTTKVQSNGILGNGWKGTKSSGGFASYCVVAASSHVVTIALPGGATYTFQPTFTQPCAQFVGPQNVNMIFTPTGLTPPNVSLAVFDGAGLYVFGSFPGDVTLADPDSFEDYDPDQFLLTLPSGQQVQISKSFGVQAIADKNGKALTISSSGITSSSGAGVAFTRDAQNRIATITDPQGNVLNYTYSATGDLTQVQDAMGHVSTFVYDSFHDLVSYVDGSGHQPIRNVYDDSGRLIQVIDAFGNVTNLSHDLGASTETVVDALGGQTSLVYDAHGNILSVTDPLGHVTTSSYDASDNILSNTDPLGHTTTSTYDANNNRLTQSDGLGHTITQTFDASNNPLTAQDANGNTTTNTYDSNGNILSTSDAAGNTLGFAYDSNGNQTSRTDALGHVSNYTYDRSGNLATSTDAAGASTTFTYDGNGNRIAEVVTRTTAAGPQTQTTQFQYDTSNNLIRTTNPDGTTKTKSYNAGGQITSQVDELGRTIVYTYDAAGRVAQVTDPTGRTVTSTYDANGQRTQITPPSGAAQAVTYDAAGNPVTSTDVNTGSVTQTIYDAAGRKTSVIDPRGNATSYTYDAANHTTSVTDALHHVTTFTYDAAGNKISILDANGNTTLLQYDSNNRLFKTVYPDGSFDQVTYDANGKKSSQTDAAGHKSQFAYDSKGHLTTVTDALGAPTSYAYDEVGDRISQTDANGHVTAFTYDGFGRRIGRTLPGGQSESFTYDPAGNMTSHTDFLAKVTTYAFDPQNRLVSKTPDSSFHAPAVTYTYTPAGLRATMTDATGTSGYSYDSADRLIQVSKPNGTISYSYDLADNLTSIATGGGTNVTYTYDAVNRLASASETSTGVTTYSYDAIGNLIGAAYPNGISNTRTYNSKNQLTNLSAAKGGAPVASYAYTLDLSGRRLAVADLGGRAATYTYDSTYRLTAETVAGAASGPNGSVAYVYDAVGNRLQTTSTLAGVAAGSFTYDADDRLTSDTYDANGNTTLSGAIGDVYDFENHLVQQGAVTLVYDGDGNRVSKTAGGVTTKYLVVEQNPTGFAQVMEESGSDGSTRKLVYGLQRISQKALKGGTTFTSFYVYDGHGSVRSLTNAGGAVTDTYDYDAFGNLIHQTGSTPNEFLFAGEQFDADLGMYYNRARYLKPSAGRFFTMDTIDGDPQSPATLHKYLYAGGDPVSLSDPSGNDPDLGSTMGSLAINTTLNLTISFGFSMLFGNPGSLVAEHLLPPGFLGYATTHLPDALLAGFGGTLTGDPSETGEGAFGLTAAGGFDAVISWKNWALYAYGGLGISLGPTSNGGSVAFYAGVLWKTKHSDDYEGWFKNYSLPLTTMGAKGQKLVEAYMTASQLVSKFTGRKVYKAQVIRAVDFVSRGLSKVPNCTLTFFFDPTKDDGSMGFSLAFSPSSIGSSSNFAFSFTYFHQIAPAKYVPFQ